MNQRKVKSIRKEIYGDMALRNTKYYIGSNGQVIADSLRRQYQEMKGRRNVG